MRRFLVLMAATAMALGVLGACSSGSGGSDKSTSAGSTAMTLEAYDNYFKPAQLTAPAGQKLTLEVKNEGPTLHNFSIDALGISKDIEAGKKVTVTIPSPAAGTLNFYCKYHQALGMTGTIASSG
jgi:plastocyanin